MIPSRPVIFSSAVSKELGPLRDLLHRSFEQHFRVITQDITLSQNTGHGVRELLAKAVEEAGCVIHLTGHSFGGTATLPFPEHPGFQCS